MQPDPAPADLPDETFNPVRPASAASARPDDDLGLDREFWVKLAQVPAFALLFTALGWLGWWLWGVAGLGAPNFGTLAVLCGLMLLAAWIDGYAFKVPNWVTLGTVVSGWLIGLLYSLGVPVTNGEGGLGAALLGSLLGWALLFPAYLIGGMGEGDVKMQMGFGSWVAAHVGFVDAGWKIILYSFCIGAVVGGVFAAVMIVLRGKYRQNLENVKEIGRDLSTATAGEGYEAAQGRAMARRPRWDRLPYGVPLCVGFVGYLVYLRFVLLPEAAPPSP